MKLQIQKTHVNIEVLQVVNNTMGISVELWENVKVLTFLLHDYDIRRDISKHTRQIFYSLLV